MIMVDEEETTAVAASGDIIISEPEGGKGNKYHSAKDGKFASPGKGEAKDAEKEEVSVSEEEPKKPSLSSIISKHAPKLSLADIIKKHSGENNIQQQDPNDWNNIISLKNYRKTLDKIFKANSATNLTEIQIKNLENKMNPIIRNAMLACNFDFRYILDFIKSNQILNQFSLGGRSGGYSSRPDNPNHGRAQMSNRTFGSEGIFFDQGLSYEEVMKNRKALEKYGCLMDNNPYGAATNRIAEYYGDTFWIMNDSLKQRTTFTIGDSLGTSFPTESRSSREIPVPLTDGFNYRQLGRYADSSRYNKIMNSDDSVYALTKACGVSYIEAQMHGEVLINRDVFGCCASPNDWNSPKGLQALKSLGEMGIKAFTHRRGKEYLEEVILNQDGTLEYRRVE